MKTAYWIDSGLAAEAAKSLTWFVILVFAIVGAMAWYDTRKDK